MAPTREQQDLIEAIGRVLEGDPQIEAAWLGGSLGRGGGDAFSDVDVVALVAAGPPTEVGMRYVEGVAAVAKPVLVNPLFGGRVLNVVTDDWRRFDISFVGPDDLSRYAPDQLTPLFNRGGLGPTGKPAGPYSPAPQTVLGLVNEFLRVLGLLPVAVGRQEWVLATWGTDILRRLTMELMLEENGVGPDARGGALRRNPLLTAEQRTALESISPQTASREGVIPANLELAAIFLPRARRLAERVGAAWPEAFETATRRHLEARLGVRF